MSRVCALPASDGALQQSSRKILQETEVPYKLPESPSDPTMSRLAASHTSTQSGRPKHSSRNLSGPANTVLILPGCTLAANTVPDRRPREARNGLGKNVASPCSPEACIGFHRAIPRHRNPRTSHISCSFLTTARPRLASSMRKQRRQSHDRVKTSKHFAQMVSAHFPQPPGALSVESASLRMSRRRSTAYGKGSRVGKPSHIPLEGAALLLVQFVPFSQIQHAATESVQSAVATTALSGRASRLEVRAVVVRSAGRW